MYDTIITLGNSLLQYGSLNDRIYLMKLSRNDFPEIIPKLDSLADQNNYTKIFAKVPDYAKDIFLSEGYESEAHIPGFFNGNESVYFLSKYFSPNRKRMKNSNLIKDVLKTAEEKYASGVGIPILADVYHARQCQPEDIPEIAQLYRLVFKTYPFPIHDPDYILKTMQENVTYFGIWDNNKQLVSLSSAEMDLQSKNVEMTDFATLPECQGKGFSTFLLHIMENYVRSMGLVTGYTIARSLSYGMNIAFAKMGYIYSGTLINNTNISGNLESMNIWYKHL